MDSKVKEISNIMWTGIIFTLRLLLAFINTIFLVVILIGSVTSMILLYKLYPEIWTELIIIISPGTLFILSITKFIFNILLILIILYFIFHLGVFIINNIEKSREKRKEKREKFLDDLAKKITNRIKKK